MADSIPVLIIMGPVRSQCSILTLLLIPSAIEQLHGSAWHTKLDLWRAYTLVRIQAGNKWNMFSVLRLVIPIIHMILLPFFQAFLNYVFRDMLNRFVIIYLYSSISVISLYVCM